MIPRACTPYRPCFLFFGLLCLLHGVYGVEDRPLHAAGPSTRAGFERPAPPASSGEPDDEIETGDYQPVVTEPEIAHNKVSLGRGGTLAGALARLGLTPAECQPLITALRSELDLARLPPTTGLSVAVDDRGRLVTLSVRAAADHFYRVGPLEAAGEQPRTERVKLPTSIRIEHASGEVQRSVRQALDVAQCAEELTLAFADIFQWDIDLLIEPRKGDRINLVYQLRVLGDVPPDLPPFGTAASTAGQPIGMGRILAASYDGHVAQSIAFWVQRPEGGGSYYDDRGAPLRKTFLKSPLNYRRISSGFSNGRRHPVTRRVVPHHGVDFAAAAGTPVVAAADGRVIAAGWDGALGQAIRIRHGSEYVSVYGHLMGFAPRIRAGAEVNQDQVIGYVGSTGRATGPHLHYTLMQHGRAIDPMRFRNPPAGPLAPDLLPQLDRVKRVWAPLLRWDALAVADDLRQPRPGLRRGA